MTLDSLQALFLAELKDVYHAEKQLVQTLPRMAKAAVAPDLQQAFNVAHFQGPRTDSAR